MSKQSDVIIVGAGMVGLALALGLQRLGLKVRVLEKTLLADTQHADHRVSALNLASERMLRHLGVWDLIAARQPYRQMQVWEQDAHSRLSFSADELLQPALGHIVANQAVVEALFQALQSSGTEVRYGCEPLQVEASAEGVSVRLEHDTLQAALLVSAEGAHSRLRAHYHFPMLEWDYGHTALVATIATALPHEACARQVFLPSGPLALLPLPDPHHCSIVWSLPPQEAQALLALDAPAFAHRVSVASDMVLGMCQLLTPRQSFPLRARMARDLLRGRCLLVGDAAHTIHPLAGQGVNLGLMDAAAIIEAFARLPSGSQWDGELAFLQPTLRWRKTEAAQMLAGMEGIKQLFATGGVVPPLRQLGMAALQRSPALKRRLMRIAMGLDGELPLMARGG